MIMKLLLVIGIIAIVYLFFIKKKPITKSYNKDNNSQSNDMIECASCKVYFEINEAILSDAKYYCSNECLEKS